MRVPLYIYCPTIGVDHLSFSCHFCMILIYIYCPNLLILFCHCCMLLILLISLTDCLRFFTIPCLTVLLFPFQEVHAPILSIWGVKIVVIAIFVGFALASIVSLLICFYSILRLSFFCLCFLLLISNLSLSAPHRHYALELILVWSSRLFYPETRISRFNTFSPPCLSCSLFPWIVFKIYILFPAGIFQ